MPRRGRTLLIEERQLEDPILFFEPGPGGHGGLAGPGSMMTVTLLTENYSRSILQQAQTVGIVALCLTIVVLIYFAAEPISRVLGKGGLSTISRVMGLILSSIAVTNGVVAIKLVFGLS